MTSLRRALFGPTSTQRRLAALLLAMALALRVLVPAGMMPVVDAAHGLTVAICDGSGVAHVERLPLHGSDPAPAHGTAMACPFAVLAGGALAGGGSPAIAEASPRPLALPNPRFRARAPDRVRDAQPPQTGPPASV